LYLDLYVHEYLRFVGGLYGIKGSVLKRRVGEMVELCGLGNEQNKRIEMLSKGYRQRVGLAQALLHDPSVLILDEPTTGLDPNQIIEIRKLIKETSRNKTVIFSTHIMQEVQALCDRVIVINKGEIVADNSLSKLMQMSSSKRMVVAEFEGDVGLSILQEINGVVNIEKLEGNRFRFTSDIHIDIRPEIFRLAADKQLSLVGLKQEENSLENIFGELTSKPDSQ
jgi:ABC-2 type transport system ATP-binding protein